ncbi:hypothetical protein [Secundilactobacillus folii]|uniref:Uncharacterized protein n=1 Tax=Secundilactobacillus folii TaxID=2678357 RepID=A0A7X2XX22_9LACO|nr:hypothetical protein [Secundilactobacillus folii]MTV82690.1 hypothetical protein [Secundilactobacillus folii]
MDWTIFRFLIVVGIVFLIATIVFFVKKATRWEIGVLGLCTFAAFGIAALQIAMRILQKVM